MVSRFDDPPEPIPMLKQFFTFRITHKVALIGGIGVLGLVLVSTIYLLGSAAQDLHRKAASDARAISALTDKVALRLLDSRRAEKDFLLRNDSAYAQRHSALV